MCTDAWIVAAPYEAAVDHWVRALLVAGAGGPTTGRCDLTVHVESPPGRTLSTPAGIVVRPFGRQEGRFHSRGRSITPAERARGESLVPASIQLSRAFLRIKQGVCFRLKAAIIKAALQAVVRTKQGGGKGLLVDVGAAVAQRPHKIRSQDWPRVIGWWPAGDVGQGQVVEDNEPNAEARDRPELVYPFDL